MTQTALNVLLTINLASAVFNIVMGLRAVRLIRCEQEAKARVAARMEHMAKAIAFCAFIANDTRAPEALRELARASIPPDVSVSVTPITTSPTERVH